MQQELQGLRIAILAGDGVDPSAVLEPRSALQQAGAETALVSAHAGQLQTRHEQQPGPQLPIDADLYDARLQRFDGLLIVGDCRSTDRLRANRVSAAFVEEFFRHGKPVAALDYGAALVLEAQALCGRKLTCANSLKEDVACAGAYWQDRPIVSDGNLLTGHTRQDALQLGRRLVRLLQRRRRISRRRRSLRLAGRRVRCWWRNLKPLPVTSPLSLVAGLRRKLSP